MLAVAVIVFREVLEAALIVSIVLVASRGLRARRTWIGAGVAAGTGGSLVAALFASSIAMAFSGAGQELLNATVLLLAVVMLAWHNIWMARHGAELSLRAYGVSADIAAGKRPLSALALVTGIAVLREGTETVLFIAGVATSAEESPSALAAGGILGLALGAAMGAALYAGLLRIPPKRLFAVTGWLVLLLAAGLAAQAAGFLVQADLLPALGEQIWDTSFLLSEASILGKLLHTMLGYVARPAGIQLFAYGFTLVAIGGPMLAIAHRRGKKVTSTAAIVALALLSATSAARAELHVRSPIVDEGEIEIEHNGLVTLGKRGSGFNGAQSYTQSLAYGITPWWKLELEGEFSAGAGRRLTFDATTIENTFQLTPHGKYFVDLGFFAEYSQARARRDPNAVVFGPIVQKELNNVLGIDSLHTLNVFFARETGRGANRATSLEYAFQSRLLLNKYIDPALEMYGTIENLAHAGGYRSQTHLIGPALVGGVDLGGGKLKYEIGYMVGLTPASPTGGVRWKLELEFRF